MRGMCMRCECRAAALLRVNRRAMRPFESWRVMSTAAPKPPNLGSVRPAAVTAITASGRPTSAARGPVGSSRRGFLFLLRRAPRRRGRRRSYTRGNWYRTLMPAPLSLGQIMTSPRLTSRCIASQQASIDELPFRTDLQSSLELMTTAVAPCEAALRSCSRNS